MKNDLKRRKKFAALFWVAAIFFCMLLSFYQEAPEDFLELWDDEIVSAESFDKDEIRICFWNVKNYLDTYRITNGKRTRAAKPESEKAEIIRTLQKINPDILGLAEIGGMPNLKEFQKLLKKHGLNYPYRVISEDNRDYPQCAILSRAPMGFSKNAGRRQFYYFGDSKRSPRGVTLASFKLGETDFIFGVVHLKSRFGDRIRDPGFSDYRVFESGAILRSLRPYKEMPTIIAGDFNDESNDKAPQLFKKEGGFSQIVSKDSGAPNHTYYWSKEKKYYMYDFFLANEGALKLSPKLSIEKINNKASDHAPVYIDIRKN